MPSFDPENESCPDPDADAALIALGWKRCFVADQSRLEDVIEAYREMGFEVTTLPVQVCDEACSACFADGTQHMVYTRRSPRGMDP